MSACVCQVGSSLWMYGAVRDFVNDGRTGAASGCAGLALLGASRPQGDDAYERTNVSPFMPVMLSKTMRPTSGWYDGEFGTTASLVRRRVWCDRGKQAMEAAAR